MGHSELDLPHVLVIGIIGASLTSNKMNRSSSSQSFAATTSNNVYISPGSVQLGSASMLTNNIEISSVSRFMTGPAESESVRTGCRSQGQPCRQSYADAT